MNSSVLHEFLKTLRCEVRGFLHRIETDVWAMPAPIKIVAAYHARVLLNDLRFAIRHVEEFEPRTADRIQDSGLDLLHALRRLEHADNGFQKLQKPNHAELSDPLNAQLRGLQSKWGREA